MLSGAFANYARRPFIVNTRYTSVGGDWRVELDCDYCLRATGGSGDAGSVRGYFKMPDNFGPRKGCYICPLGTVTSTATDGSACECRPGYVSVNSTFDFNEAYALTEQSIEALSQDMTHCGGC